MRFAIIGAGPTGLAAAARFQAAGVDWRLYEAERHPGGLSASFFSDGFTWDLGGHIVFSHYDSYDRALAALLPPQDWIEHERNTYVRILQRWVPYPFQNNIAHLPPAERDECLAGLQSASPARTAPGTFQDWIDANAGRGIARLFMNPYNFKVWAYPPSSMSANWLGERVAKPDMAAIGRSIASGTGNDRWGPNSTFRFPRKGGTGEIWRRMAASLDATRISYGHRVRSINTSRRQLSFDGGADEPYDALVSTMPLDLFLRQSDMPRLSDTAGRLTHNTVHVLGFGLEGSIPDPARGMCWLYFPEDEDPFYRVTMFSHYSPANAPAGCYSVMAEVSESPAKPVNSSALPTLALGRLRACGLIGNNDRVRSTWTRRIEHGYPIPSLDRDSILSDTLPALESVGVYSRGRFGAWKYEVGNMDHCFAQGTEIADRLLSGKPEVTVNNPALVNERGGGREARHAS